MEVDNARDAMAIVEACRLFLGSHAAPEIHQVILDRYTADYARLLVTPAGQVTDSATCYMRRDNHAWTVLALGTSFEPDFFDEHGVPAELRLDF